MTRITLAVFSAIFLFSCSSEDKKTKEPLVAAANTETKKEPEPMPDSIRNKNWNDYMTPGDPHKMMASWDGSWTGEVTMWMAPGAPPTTSTATTTNKMVMGGRYQQATHKGSYNNMPFEGMSTLAYDNHKKVFISTWIDNMGTGIMSMEGPWDPVTKSISFKGKMIDPGTGKEMEVRETFKVIDDNFQVMEMFCEGMDGKEFKTMEIKYSRKR